jgi:hypothetical protein
MQLRSPAATKAPADSSRVQVKVYELSQLALKFERHLLSEARAALPPCASLPGLTCFRCPQIIDFQILSDDYSKLVFACADRSLTFHARFGGYVSTRLPKAPRSVAYHAPSADVLAVGSASEVYRCAGADACAARCARIAAAACLVPLFAVDTARSRSQAEPGDRTLSNTAAVRLSGAECGAREPRAWAAGSRRRGRRTGVL